MKIRTWVRIGIVVILLILALNLMSRNDKIVDDVIPTDECLRMAESSDLIFVIPNYEDNSLENKDSWCEAMRELNKTIGMHGITHKYHEFGKNVSEAELKEGIELFEDCFGYKPKIFRPPYNLISPENEAKVEAWNMTVYKKRYFLQPYCHCQPHGLMKILNGLINC